MRILGIIQCANLGGMERSTLETLTGLRDAGHYVHLLSLQPLGGLETVAAERGIAVEGIGEPYRWAGVGNLARLGRLIEHQAPDRLLLAGHNFGSLLAAGRSGRPTYLSIHYPHGDRSPLLWRAFYGLAGRLCRGVRFVSEYIRQEVVHCLPPDRSVCIPNIFVPPASRVAQTEARKRLGLAPDAFIVGNAGWLIERKAFDIFLQVAARVKARVPEAVFVIAGDGPGRAALEALARQLGLADCVCFLGWQQDLAAFYGALDALLFNSHLDAMGRTPLEASLHGVPVVASVTRGGLGEFLRHGEDAFLLGWHDVEQLAGAVVRLREDPEHGQRQVRTAQARVLELCSADRHLAQMNVFLQLS